MKSKIFKRILLAALLIGLVVPTSSCGVTKIIRCMGKTKLNIFNWGSYIEPANIRAFEKEYDVCVNYVTFDSNESVILKVQMGEVYDIMVPSDYAIEQLVAEDYLLELDWSRINTFNKESDLPDELDSLLSYLKDDGFDFLKYAAPYFWGSLGIAYNTSTIDKTVMEAKLEEYQWDVLKDPATIFNKPSVRVAHYDSSRDGAAPALKAQGASLNSSNASEIANARTWLYEQKANVRSYLTYVGDDIIDDMAYTNKYDLALMYSGDAVYAMQENPNVGFFIPSIGTNIWADGMVIHKNSSKVDLAYDFINFMLQEEVAEANSTYVGYSAAHKASYEKLLHGSVIGSYNGILGEFKDAYEVRFNPEHGDEAFRYNKTSKTMIDNMWTEVKNYRP